MRNYYSIINLNVVITHNSNIHKLNAIKENPISIHRRQIGMGMDFAPTLLTTLKIK